MLYSTFSIVKLNLGRDVSSLLLSIIKQAGQELKSEAGVIN